MKLLAHIMLASIVLLNLTGCSYSGLLWSSQSEDPVVLIDNPPMRMVYAGKFTKEDKEMFEFTIREMSKMPYKDHKYTFPIGAQISINEATSSSVSDVKIVDIGSPRPK